MPGERHRSGHWPALRIRTGSRPLAPPPLGRGPQGSTGVVLSSSPPCSTRPMRAGGRERASLIPDRQSRGPRTERPKNRVHLPSQGQMGPEGPILTDEKGQRMRGESSVTRPVKEAVGARTRGRTWLRPTDVRPVRRRWHNDPESHDRAAFGHPFLAAPSPPNPRPPALGVCCPARDRGIGNPRLARTGVFASPSAAPGAPDRGAAPRRAGAAARPARDAAGPRKCRPSHATGSAPRSCAAPAGPDAAERGQAARATAAYAGAARARDSTSRGTGPSRATGGGPGARAISSRAARACVPKSRDPNGAVPRASCGAGRAVTAGGRGSAFTARGQGRGARPSRALGAVRVSVFRPAILAPWASP
jgi:hypothetical protein